MEQTQTQIQTQRDPSKFTDFDAYVFANTPAELGDCSKIVNDLDCHERGEPSAERCPSCKLYEEMMGEWGKWAEDAATCPCCGKVTAQSRKDICENDYQCYGCDDDHGAPTGAQIVANKMTFDNQL